MIDDFMKFAPIVVIGSINTDMVATAPTLPAVGKRCWVKVSLSPQRGNQAVAAARLGPRLPW